MRGIQVAWPRIFKTCRVAATGLPLSRSYSALSASLSTRRPRNHLQGGSVAHTSNLLGSRARGDASRRQGVGDEREGLRRAVAHRGRDAPGAALDRLRRTAGRGTGQEITGAQVGRSGRGPQRAPTRLELASPGSRRLVGDPLTETIVQHNSGETAKHRGVYHSNCKCRVELAIRRGDPFPACPTCRKAVLWLYTRSPMGTESSSNVTSPLD
jgi:hypothetical protein